MLRQILDVGDDHNKVVGVLFAYLFGNIDKYEYRRSLPSREMAKQIWAKVVSKGYVLQNCKLYAYAVHQNRKAGLPTSPAKFGISQDDVSILRKLNLSHINSRFKAMSIHEYTKLEESIVTDPALRTYIGKFISRKLIFLCRSYGLKRDELEAQFLVESLYALRKQYPCYESELHAMNICKTAIHNAGIGLIEFWTRKKRNALMPENGGFQAVHVQYDLQDDIGVPPAHDDPTRLNLEALEAAVLMLKPRERTFVSAAAGKYDAGFSMYLGFDNSDAAHDWEYQRYITNLRDYFKVSEVQAERLLAHLKRAII